ncbi:Bug family tripartite tricarboxylate transporter substrate binding protein [Muricoccus radiodurans]|uniref:Bug family tripartite tricarboxylate transporter substrate binding protein n=1 Tax=Muricoccus radiodurans TaxID=2231721 RepID=UPI003CED51B5
MNIGRRAALGAGLVLAAPRIVRAQGFPSRPLTLVIPFAAGGASDILARVLGQRLSVVLGVPVVADNRGGAGGTIGTEAVARGGPDGHTILWAHMGTMAVAPHVYPRLGYDPLRDLAPISVVARVPMALVVNKDLGVRNLAEFIALAKARPEEINYGTAGQASNTHIGMVALEEAAGIKLTPVHYRGSGPVMTDLVAGTVKATFTGAPAVVSLVRDGTIIGLGVSGRRPVAALPGVAPVGQTVPGFEVTQWHGIAAPGRTPPDIVAKLNEAVVAAVQSPEMRERLAAEGADPDPTTPEAFRALATEETARWGVLIRRVGLRAE